MTLTKFSVKFPSGLEITAEGDGDIVNEFRTLAIEELPALMEKLEAPPSTQQVRLLPPSTLDTGEDRETGDDGDGTEETPIDVAKLAEILEERGAKSDIERTAIMAFAAVDAGRRGLDAATADELYTELGLPKPGVWRSTFQNAKARGLVKNVAQGVWAPTVPGENFARHGIRPNTPRKRSKKK
jgi:hypothetical protein